MTTQMVRWILFSCLLALTAPVQTSLGSQSSSRYSFKEPSGPDGTGKFFMGREIARFMSYVGATWLDRPEREREEQTLRLLALLQLKPGQVVADIGAGSEYYTLRMAEQVQAEGKVYAVDIQPEMLQIIRERKQNSNLVNIELIQGSPTSPKLPPNSVDLALLVDVYHEFLHPFEMMREISHALKPGGRVVLVEYRAEDASVPIKWLHKMSEAQVRREMEDHPLQWLRTEDDLPWQHAILFTKVTD